MATLRKLKSAYFTGFLESTLGKIVLLIIYHILAYLLKPICLFSLSYLVLFSLSSSTSKPINNAAENPLIPFQDKNIIITGTVLDEKSNAPIPFAHIAVIDGKVSSEANKNGEFTLRLNPNNKHGKIKITSLGYLTQEFSIADLITQSGASTVQKFYLIPDYKSLQVVEVKAKARKLKTKKAGYHIDEGTSIHYEFYPSDTFKIKVSGHEIGNRIQLEKYPAMLRSVSFGIQGLSEAKLLMRIRLYSLKNNLPHLNLLPESAVIAIPPHHAGWITVNLQEYNIKLKEDFVVVVEWDAARERNTSSLMAFANIPKEQSIYYRESNLKSWQIIKSTLVDIKSIGMYATVVYEK